MGKKPFADRAEAKIVDALKILDALGFPRQQINERSALTLLSLLNLKPADNWRHAKNPLMGITPMMEFFAKHYGKQYKPNTRETVRRQTVHQFIQAALIVRNPDEPSRPTNSPKTVYQIEGSALKLLRQFGRPAWSKRLKEYLRAVKPLKNRYARERKMRRVPVKLGNGKKIRLSPGDHNVLTKKIIDDFCPRFTPGAQVIYVGDTQDKWAYFDADTLKKLAWRWKNMGKCPMSLYTM